MDPTTHDDRPSGEDVQAILEAWFQQADAGGDPDVQALCRGDAALAARVRALLEEAPAIDSLIAALPGRDGAGTRDTTAAHIGDFRLLGCIGEGGMGRVHVAIQESLGRAVAVKVLDDRWATDDRAALRLRREAEIAAALDHPHIVPIHELGVDDGHPYIAMKWLTGPSLDRLEGPLDPQETARIGAAVGDALHAAHLLGVVHRDVKPGNIILDDGKPYLVDFGLARATEDVGLTRSGVIPGTLPYLAPEQLSSRSPVLDPRTDVYALGVTLYETVSGGRLPMGDTEPEKIVDGILHRDPEPLNLQGRDRDLEVIIMRALEKDPSRRFPTARALADDLERYLEGRPIVSKPVGLGGRLVRTMQRHPRVAGGAALAVIAVAVLASVLVMGARQRQTLLEERVRTASAALQDGDLPRTRALVTELLREAEDDPDVAKLARALDADEATDALLNEITQRSIAQNAYVLERIMGRVAASEAIERNPRTVRAALACIALFGGDRQRVLQLADEIDSLEGDHGGADCDTTALRAAVAGKLPRTVACREGADPDRPLIAAAALRVAGNTPEQRLALIEEATQRDEDHVRAKVARAEHYAVVGKNDEALAAYLTLEASRPGVRRGRARILLLMGRPSDAAAEIEAIPPSHRDNIAVLLHADVRLAVGDEAGARALVASLDPATTSDPEVLEKAARYALRDQDWGRAEELLGRSLENAIMSVQRDRVRTAQVAVALMATVDTADPLRRVGLDTEQRTEIVQIRKRAAELATELGSDLARARAMATMAWACWLLHDFDAALDAQHAARTLSPDDSSLAVNHVAYATARGAGLSADQRKLAEASARGVTEAGQRGVSILGPTPVADAWLFLAASCSERKDAPGCRKAATEALAMGERLGDAYVTESARAFLALADELQRSERVK